MRYIRIIQKLKKHPVNVDSSTSAARQQDLLNAVAAIVAAGDDPDSVLKTALEKHVTDAPDVR